MSIIVYKNQIVGYIIEMLIVLPLVADASAALLFFNLFRSNIITIAAATSTTAATPSPM